MTALPAVENVAVSTLRAAPWNPRTIADARFQALCASLAADPDFLWLRPILATRDGTDRLRKAIDYLLNPAVANFHQRPYRENRQRGTARKASGCS